MIPLSPPTLHSMHSLIQHGSSSNHGGIFCRQEPAFSESQSSETEFSNTDIVLALASQREREARRHEQESSERRHASLYHITAAITACIIIIDMAIPLTRANRLAAMRGKITTIHVFTPFMDPARPPALYVCPIQWYRLRE